MPGAVERRLYRSLLHCVRAFKQDCLPLTGVVLLDRLGARGGQDRSHQEPAVALPQLPQPLSLYSHGADFVHELRRAFRQRGPYSLDDAFTLLRSLNAQHSTLVGAEEETRQALRAWRHVLDLHAGRHAGNMSCARSVSAATKTAAAPLFPHMASTRALAAGVESACDLVAALWQAGQLEGLDDEWEGAQQQEQDTDSEAGTDEGSEAAALRACLAAAQPGQSGPRSGVGRHEEAGSGAGLGAGLGSGVHLSHVLDLLATEVARREGPALFPHGALPLLGSDCGISSSSAAAAGAVAGPATASQAQQLDVILRVLFTGLAVRNEPIEWVYDGLGPLLLPRALAARKAAPLALAVTALGLCARLGVPATLLRATSALEQLHGGVGASVTGSAAGDGAESAAGGMGVGGRARGVQQWGAGAGAGGLPPEVAARFAGRAASALPLDAWVVAALAPVTHGAGLGRGAGAGRAQAGSMQAVGPAAAIGNVGVEGACGEPRLAPSGVFLDVSRRRGEGLSAQQLGQRYPAAAAAAARMVDDARRSSSSSSSSSSGSNSSSSSSAGCPGACACAASTAQQVVWVCGQVARAVMVAHQRRGESDAVAHWLWQVLALDPDASEWAAVMGAGAGAARSPAAHAATAATARTSGDVPDPCPTPPQQQLL